MKPMPFGNFPRKMPPMPLMRLEMHPKGIPGITPQWVIVTPAGQILESTRSDKADDAVMKYKRSKLLVAVNQFSQSSWKTMLDYAVGFSSDCFGLVQAIMTEKIDGYDVNMIGDQIVPETQGPVKQFTRKEILATIKDDEESR